MTFEIRCLDGRCPYFHSASDVKTFQLFESERHGGIDEVTVWDDGSQHHSSWSPHMFSSLDNWADAVEDEYRKYDEEWAEQFRDKLSDCSDYSDYEPNDTTANSQNNSEDLWPIGNIFNLITGRNFLKDADESATISEKSEDSSISTVFFGIIYTWVFLLFFPSLGLKLSIFAWRVCLDESALLVKYVWRYPIAILCSVIGIASVCGIAQFLIISLSTVVDKKISLLLRIEIVAVLCAATGYYFMWLGFFEDLPWAVHQLGYFIVWLWHFLGAVLRWIWCFIFGAPHRSA